MMNDYYLKKKNITKKYKLLLFMLIVVFISATSLFAQERIVSGKVIEASTGEGLPGATVRIKGTNKGTISDTNGQFQLPVTDKGSLVCSFVGYKTVEIEIGSSSNVTFELEIDVTQLSEVVVVGYGQIDKKDVTGSIVDVGRKEFNGGIITAPEQLLVGKVPGVQIISNGGEPGGGSTIRIRGATSLSASSSPLIVIDGVPVDDGKVAGGRNPLNFINSSDIENITVLKDASATAIYGSRAANGVILVTTKSGQPGKIKVNYDAFYSVTNFIKKPGNLSASNFRALIDSKAPQELNNLGDANTDWVKEVTQPATGLKQMISASGGTDNHRVYGSVNYLKNNGVINTSSNENINLGLKYNGSFLNNLNITLNAKYGKTKDRFANNVLGAAMSFDPTQPVRDGNAETGGYFQWDDPLATRNPVATLELIENTGETNRFLGNVELEYSIPFVEGLSVKTNLSTDVSHGTSKNLNPMLNNIYTGAAADSGRFGLYEETRTSKLIEVYGVYKKELKSIKSQFDVTGGYSWQGFEFDKKGIQVIKLGNNFDKNNPRVGTQLDEQDSTFSENRLISFFGRVNFQMRDKYLLTFNIRKDGSTKFGKSNRWGLFPSLALGWRVLDESFAAPLKTVFSDLKFRVGYGVIGNQGIDDYLYLPVYTPSENDARYQFGYDSSGKPVFVTMIRPNAVDPDIKWEETRTTNIGVDFGVFEGRLTGSIDYYIKKTTDLLSRVAFPAGSTTGDLLLTNIGEMENKGVELLLSSIIIDNDKVHLSTTFNIARNTNTIKSLDNSNLPDFPGYETGGITGDIGQNIQILKVGYPINSFRTYIRDDNGVTLQGVKYRDINDDGQITDLDRVIDKDPAPAILTGLTTNLTYNKFDMGITFRGSFGNYVYNNVSSSTGYYQRLDDRVTNNVHESVLETNYNRKQLFSDYYIENASFVKLDNISIGYNTAFKSMKIRVYTTFQNVLTISGYSGIDPEISNGIDNNIYPRSLTSLLGLSITF